jgi:3-hydroxyacyl-CoA dehydrogenase
LAIFARAGWNVRLTEAHRPTLEAAREIDGFVLNRLQGALLAEAFRLVGEATSPRKIWITR